MRHVIAVLSTAITFALPVQAQVGPNMDDLAKELANPGAANATLNFKFEYRTFRGTLPGANDQDSFTATFQPVLPFVLNNGNNLIFRPSLPYVFGQPAFDAGTSSFAETDNIGDIPYDIQYSWQSAGWTLGAGVVGTIPTGSNNSNENWLLGPSFLAVNPTDWGIFGLFPFHHEKVGGSGADVSLTSLQYFLFYGLSDGWQIGISPTISYDWKAIPGNEWTVPFGLQLAKTTMIGKQVVKLNAGIEYNVVRPDNFASDWKFRFTFSPVTKNPFQRNPPVPKAPVDAVTRATVLAPIR